MSSKVSRVIAIYIAVIGVPVLAYLSVWKESELALGMLGTLLTALTVSPPRRTNNSQLYLTDPYKKEQYIATVQP